jgi:hypothetical protein
VPRKKHPSTRARRNVASTAATLVKREPVDYTPWTVPELREECGARGLPKTGTKDQLATRLILDDDQIPALPEREVGWHPQTWLMWADIWSSPMSEEWDDSDIHNAYALALVYDDIWRASSSTGRKEALSEYRLQRVDLGLSPYSRRRLEWTIEAADEAKSKGRRRRAEDAPKAVPPPEPGDDPRLTLVST